MLSKSGSQTILRSWEVKHGFIPKIRGIARFFLQRPGHAGFGHSYSCSTKAARGTEETSGDGIFSKTVTTLKDSWPRESGWV